MPAPITVPIAPDLAVSDNYTIRITAIDPDTGAVVTGITISKSAILARDVSGDSDVTVPTQKPPTNTAVLLPGPAM